MATMKKQEYTSPAIRVAPVDFDCSFCISGTHEGFTEEDWDEP